ncbi:ribosome maturation factor RimM [Photobacterium carnosum]|uniref:Ribosome maturation factor RimM n=1 Tax=Photobacterium carnosum TaxID=2023717 RepID=A0A2N4UM51_9GAMM|nr:ribosome maturation factor RimM [Photobacterium carnosum]KAE8175583.1 ribosome maturation factor RimM [Photobacterium carnosum]MBY3790575.1 ribosome maturation factor RimM [Photobacterium carnosum]MCD9496670.1 ribosome maturation factor RimM [Photobacterium carnosum]MCD9500415.1 ribosome maturation factor RimM [Photobacterium carnosum]MCD9516736.1 ribosome maturation factor RimM [Photobacterium carnosum]
MSIKNQDHIIVGKLGATYGIKGWLKVFSYTEESESIFSYTPWMIKIKGEWTEIHVESWKRHGQGLVAKLEGMDIREDAQVFTNAEVAVLADQLPVLSDEEFYWRELFGMTVVTTKGYDLGKVTDILETGANDVLVVKANLKDAFGQKERLIPFLDEQVIKLIDRTAQRIEVDWDPEF